MTQQHAIVTHCIPSGQLFCNATFPCRYRKLRRSRQQNGRGYTFTYPVCTAWTGWGDLCNQQAERPQQRLTVKERR